MLREEEGREWRNTGGGRRWCLARSGTALALITWNLIAGMYYVNNI